MTGRRNPSSLLPLQLLLHLLSLRRARMMKLPILPLPPLPAASVRCLVCAHVMLMTVTTDLFTWEPVFYSGTVDVMILWMPRMARAQRACEMTTRAAALLNGVCLRWASMDRDEVTAMSLKACQTIFRATVMSAFVDSIPFSGFHSTTDDELLLKYAERRWPCPRRASVDWDEVIAMLVQLGKQYSWRPQCVHSWSTPDHG